MATGSLDEVSGMRADGCEHTVDVLEFCNCVLDGHIRDDSDLKKRHCMLIIVVLYLFRVGYSMLLGLLDTCLPLWCKRLSMCWQCVLDWVPKELLCW